MKKLLLYGATALSLSASSLSLNAQKNIAADQNPNIDYKNPSVGSSKAIWDVHFSHNLTSSASGDVGMAAVCYYYSQYWVSRWASDTIYRFNTSGALVSEFVIAGLTGVRGLTTDGVYLYASTNTSTIYRIDPMLQSLAPPHITISAPVTARFCTYDATLNSGAGGFWIGNFDTDIVAISTTGTTLSTIAAGTHGLTGMYGGAIDNLTAGGPYLWIFDQSGTNTTQIYQIPTSTGIPSGVTRDVYTDFSTTHSLTSGLAGGMFLTDQIVAGEVTLMGIIQGTPNNVIFGYEIGTSGSASINNNESEILNVYPNPSNVVFTINAKESQITNYQVIDVNGKIILNGNIQSDYPTIDISSYPNGTYILQVFSNGKRINEKTILKQ